jgi:hypothetical protein
MGLVWMDVGIVCGGRGEVFVQHKITPWRALGVELDRVVELWFSLCRRRPAKRYDHLGCKGDGLRSCHMNIFLEWLRLVPAVVARVLVCRWGLIE